MDSLNQCSKKDMGSLSLGGPLTVEMVKKDYLEAGADAEAMEGCCLLACLTCYLMESRTTYKSIFYKTTSQEMVSPIRGWTLPSDH